MKKKRTRKYRYLKPREIMRVGDEMMSFSNKGTVLLTVSKYGGFADKQRMFDEPLHPVRRLINTEEE
jgi:hypothetical protein